MGKIKIPDDAISARVEGVLGKGYELVIVTPGGEERHGCGFDMEAAAKRALKAGNIIRTRKRKFDSR